MFDQSLVTNISIYILYHSRRLTNISESEKPHNYLDATKESLFNTTK